MNFPVTCPFLPLKRGACDVRVVELSITPHDQTQQNGVCCFQIK